jgi:hypothetical protein
MTDFLEIARRTKREHEARLELARTHAEHERRLQEQVLTNAVSALQVAILPTLHRARAELARDELCLVIEDNFTSAPRAATAEVSIRIVGAEVPSAHAGRVKPESVPAFFSHDGSTLAFGLGKRRGQLAEYLRPVVGEPASVIEYAVAQLAASYFVEIEAMLQQSAPERAPWQGSVRRFGASAAGR